MPQMKISLQGMDGLNEFAQIYMYMNDLDTEHSNIDAKQYECLYQFHSELCPSYF